jgi:hypothetical protein
LRETPEVRKHALTAMREWILSNPRIEKCRMDSIWLLRFLRFRKYSIPLAQEALERYLIFREGLYGYDWFSNMDYDRLNLKVLLDKGVIVPLPEKDKLGRQVLMFRLLGVDPSINDVGNAFLTLSTFFFETLLDNEENQIRGVNYLGDVTGLQLGHVNIFPLEVAYKFGKNVEVSHRAKVNCCLKVDLHPFKFQYFLFFFFCSENMCRSPQRIPYCKHAFNSSIHSQFCYEAHAGQIARASQILQCCR